MPDRVFHSSSETWGSSFHRRSGVDIRNVRNGEMVLFTGEDTAECLQLLGKSGRGMLACGAAEGEGAFGASLGLGEAAAEPQLFLIKEQLGLGPRGIPQIEVTFDIDANGIVHVTAKDLGTQKSADITITSSTNLSEDEINKAVKEAEQYAEEDKKRKKAVDNRNALDGMIFQMEKALKENGDKLPEEDKAKLDDLIKEAKVELESNDNDRIKAATEKLSNEAQAIFAKIYQQAGGAPNGDANGTTTDGDTEFHQ